MQIPLPFLNALASFEDWFNGELWESNYWQLIPFCGKLWRWSNAVSFIASFFIGISSLFWGILAPTQTGIKQPYYFTMQNCNRSLWYHLYQAFWCFWSLLMTPHNNNPYSDSEIRHLYHLCQLSNNSTSLHTNLEHLMRAQQIWMSIVVFSICLCCSLGNSPLMRAIGLTGASHVSKLD